MKIINSIIVSGLVLSASIVYGQNRDSLLYSVAYEYIKNDSETKNYLIIPSIKLVHTSYNDVLAVWKTTDIDSLKTITSQDLENVYKKYKITGAEALLYALSEKTKHFDEKSLDMGADTLNYLFPAILNRDASSTFTLYFSKIFKDELFIILKELCDEDIEDCRMDGFYFKFYPDATIKIVQRWYAF